MHCPPWPLSIWFSLLCYRKNKLQFGIFEECILLIFTTFASRDILKCFSPTPLSSTETEWWRKKWTYNWTCSIFSSRFLLATLTSYSADSAAEREDSAKYPSDGYHSSSLNLWQQSGRPVVASTSSSCVVAGSGTNDSLLYRAEDNMSASTYSLNKLHPDRGPGSAHSSGSTHSITLNLIPRPNSVAGKISDVTGLWPCVNQVISSPALHTSFPVRKEMHHFFLTMVNLTETISTWSRIIY